MNHHHPHDSVEKWASRLGLILVVASGAIGLGNFLRFPGQAVKNGGGAFMIPYIISFLVLGIPVCWSEWTMGRMGGKHGHSAPRIFSHFSSGFSLKLISAIAIAIPTLIYVYYVFIEAWCLSYAISFLTKSMNLHPANVAVGSEGYTAAIIQNSNDLFVNLVGSKSNGSSFQSEIIYFTIICYLLNFYIIYRGLSKGLETLAKIAMPLLMFFSIIILVKVLSLDRVTEGLGKMWNPDWQALSRGEVWVAAAGQIFFSINVGFGIILSFTSYLDDKDDVTLSALSAASLNEFVEVVFGGLITIPISFIFLGLAVTSYGTFGIGFIALPAVFSLMPAGEFFGAVWYFVLFIAAITSSVTMIQPGVSFLQEGFKIKKRYALIILFAFTFILTLGIVYFNEDFAALDNTDFWIGTILIYILATIQVIIYGWKIGTEKGREESQKGGLIPLPKIFDFTIKYITPVFLIVVFIVFSYQDLPKYMIKMNSKAMVSALVNPSSALIAKTINQAHIAKGVFISIILIFLFIFYLVHRSVNEKQNSSEDKWANSRLGLILVVTLGLILVMVSSSILGYFFPNTTVKNGEGASDALNIQGLFIMIVSVTLVTGMSGYCIYKLLTNQEKKE